MNALKFKTLLMIGIFENLKGGWAIIPLLESNSTDAQSSFDTYTSVGYDEGYLEKIPLGSRGIWITRVQQGQSKYPKAQGVFVFQIPNSYQTSVYGRNTTVTKTSSKIVEKKGI